MSLGGNLSGISFSGLSSGIDTATILKQLMQVESIPLTRMQGEQAQLQARLEVYNQLQTKVSSLASAIAGLNTAAAFQPVTGSVSDATVASLSVGSDAVAGQYAVHVTRLATAHKVLSAAQSAPDTALNKTGQIMVDGKAVSVTATDTLATIAAKINATGSNAVASIVNGGTGSAYLSITSKDTGAANGIQAADVTGTVLSDLGLIAGAKAYREAVNGGFRSYGLGSATASIASQTGSNASGAFTINGQAVSVDFAVDTLSSVAAKINAAAGGSGAVASVVSVTTNGKTVQKLQVVGMQGLPGDADNLLAGLGALQQGYSNEVTQARDASYSVDNVPMTSATNQVSGVIQGVTLTLLKEGADTTVSLTRDAGKIKASFKSLTDAFNGLIDYVKSASGFDDKTFDSGPLFGDSVAGQVVGSVEDTVFQTVGNGTYRSLADLGFGLDSDGKLTLNESKLDAALATDPAAVQGLMVSAGSSSNPDLTYVSSTSRTQDAGPAGYTVNVTQLATKALTVGTFAASQGNRGGETLTFAGPAFSQQYALDIAQGATLQDVVNQINANATLKDKVVASLDGSGHLQIEALKYGSASDFTVTSNLDAADDTTGIGTGGGIYTKGVDIAGTINGEAATGTGQYLIGKDDNPKTAGLQVRYAGTQTGTVGVVSFSKGLASRLAQGTDIATDVTSGLLPAVEKSIQSQIDDLTTRITDFQATLNLRQDSLKKKFLAMEQAIAQLQQQQAQFNARLNGSG